MKITYTKKESVSAERPPVEPGIYAVQRKGGGRQEATWDGLVWIGFSDVERYSGRPMLLSSEARQLHLRNIRAGLEVPEGLEQRSIAQKCAMELARHNAVKLATSDSSKMLARVRNMIGYFTIARTLGVSFFAANNAGSSATDRSFFEWGIAQLRERDPAWLGRAETKLKDIDGVREWLTHR